MPEYEEIDPRFKESLLNWMKTNNPFWSLLGMELSEIKTGWARIRLPVTKKDQRYLAKTYLMPLLDDAE